LRETLQSRGRGEDEKARRIGRDACPLPRKLHRFDREITGRLGRIKGQKKEKNTGDRGDVQIAYKELCRKRGNGDGTVTRNL
jgi:hypothetical protein